MPLFDPFFVQNRIFFLFEWGKWNLICTFLPLNATIKRTSIASYRRSILLSDFAFNDRKKFQYHRWLFSVLSFHP